jgi:FixJ family two-component response regulator
MDEPALIVAVDDDRSFLRSVVRLLKANGLEVRAFSSAEGPLQHGDLSKASCLLFDIHLGAMSGIDLHRELKREGSSVPVVFMTGNDTPAIRQAAEEEGCVGFLRKPFTEEDLIETIKRALTARLT